jgi:signal transduction histidine kinase
VSARAGGDALLAAVLVLIGGIAFVKLDSAERITSTLMHFERFDLDDLLLTGCLAIATLSWFAWRRWNDALRELDARRASERQNAIYVQKLEQLSSQLLQSEQDARARISELLHDEIGQTLYAGRLQLERIEPRLADPDCRVLLAGARQLVGDALTRTRDLTLELNPPVLDDLGLHAALQWLGGRTYERWALNVRVIGAELWDDVPRAWHGAIFQSVRELQARSGLSGRGVRVAPGRRQAADRRLRRRSGLRGRARPAAWFWAVQYRAAHGVAGCGVAYRFRG